MPSEPRKPKSKAVKRASVPKTPVTDISPDEQIVGAPLLGKVREYDARKREMLLVLEEPLSNGDAMRVKGRETDLSQRAERLSVDGRCVQSAMAGESVRVTVADRVRKGDAVYKVRSS